MFVVLNHVRVGVFFLTVRQEVVLDASTFGGLLTLVLCGVVGSGASLDPESSGSLRMKSSVILLGLGQEDTGGAVVHRTLVNWSCV